MVSLALLLVAACDSSDEEAPITCYAFEKCYGEGSISVNALRCRSYIDDPACGQPYRAWLRCYTSTCSGDADAGEIDRICQTEQAAWRECLATSPRDASVE